MAKDGRLYAKFTLDFADNYKILPLSDAAFRAFVTMVLASTRGKTNGKIDPSEWDQGILAELRESELLADSLIVDFENYPRGGHEGRPAIPVGVRRAVMERDGYQCVTCGSTEALSMDHIIRFRDGGPDTVDNLRVLCMPCNLERG